MSQRAVDVLLDAATAGARGEKHPAIEFLHRVNEACTRAAGALTRRVLTTARKSGGSASFSSGDMEISVRSGKCDIMLEAVRDDQRMTIRCLPWSGHRVGILHSVSGIATDEVEDFIADLASALPKAQLLRRPPAGGT